MRFEDMTAEQVERARKCETAEERKTFVEAEGIELSDEKLDTIAGGYVVDRGSGRRGSRYVTVDDSTGKILHFSNERWLARQAARKAGASPEVITPETYEEIFGKPL